MPEAGSSGSVQLLEADPDLGRGLDPRRIREVSQRLFVRAIDAPRGPWTPGRALNHGSQPIGLLVLDGLLVREATVGDHPCAEQLGARATCCAHGTTGTPRSCCRARSSGPR